MSLQTGKPWMIGCDDFMESIESWCADPMATENDQLLGAFVTLRLSTSAALELLVPRSQGSGTVEAAGEAGEQDCHQFLIRFYGTHLRLQLYSLPLQGILESTQTDTELHLETIWVAYTSAMSMLQLISRFSSQPYFAQDSIHVMTAYSAVFLVKILLSVPSLATGQVESNTIEAIQVAAGAFPSQSGTPRSSCALQARFLSRVASKLLESQGERRGAYLASYPPRDPRTDQEERLASEGYPAPLQPFDAATSEISLMQGGLDLTFEGAEMWADLFATVGLGAQDDVFIS
ncbi:hypothetical protein ACJZ2D_013120 [Fusarium nematophilum]